MSETWCFCPVCDRWFYPETAGGDVCPVCGTTASKVEKRATG
jgi:predicted amidophosphoribosyltransferase